MNEQIDEIIKKVNKEIHNYESFHSAVETFFRSNPLLKGDPPVIHSIKGRIKNIEHLREKILRKEGITTDNVLEKITDIAGIRVMHLYQKQFSIIHEAIIEQITNKHWALFEQPKAYTWDPDSVDYFKALGIETIQKESLYTSIHYVVKPRNDSFITCEIQVRTLFEEAWGEIDHWINYPKETSNQNAKEQIRILARMIGSGSRLADLIFDTVKPDSKTDDN